jgi:chemotaxis signal transduction protein
VTTESAIGARRGGIVLRAGGTLWFVPASVAIKVEPVPDIARVPGAPPDLLGIALVDGDIVPVLALDDALRARPGSARALLVCHFLGETVGLLATSVVRTGVFSGDGESILYEGERALPLDLTAMFARLHAGSWAGRWRR